MARPFFYVCAGILMLTTAFTTGAMIASADWVPGQVPNVLSFGGGTVLGSDWTMWELRVDTSPGGSQVTRWVDLNASGNAVSANVPPPVPLQDIVVADRNSCLARTGDVWIWGGDLTRAWLNGGPVPPAATVAAAPMTWSRVKQGYRK